MIFEIILIIILLIIILLYIGIDLIGNFKKESSQLTFNFKILLFKKIKLYNIEYPSNENKEEKKEKSQLNLETLEPCIGTFITFFKSLLKTMKVEKLEIHIDLGLSSYVSTAKYVGFLWAIFVLPNTTMKNTSFTATPHFGERVFDFKGIVDVRINLLKLIIPIIKLISNKNVRKVIKMVK